MAPRKALLPHASTTERGFQMSFAQTQGTSKARVREALTQHWPALRDDAIALAKALPRIPGSDLIAMNVRNVDGTLVAANGEASALDAARGTRGLAELALALAGENRVLARELARAAADQWRASRRVLRGPNGRARHWVSLGPDGEPVDERMGETGPHDRRVNADALYPASDSLYLVLVAERFPELGLDPRPYEEALKRDVAQLVADFFHPAAGTLAYHSHAESGAHDEPDYPGGIVGNDGTVYGLAALWVPALDVLAEHPIELPKIDGGKETVSFAELVRRQLDVLVDNFQFMHGSMWETYHALPDGKLDPVRFAWQDQPVTPPVTLSDGRTLTRSHVAIGGHTVMAAQVLAQGALELYRLGHIDAAQRGQYLNRATRIVQEAVDHRVIEWDEGRVQNANLLEVPVEYLDARRRPGGNDWGQAAWQQRELLQTLLVLREANRLDHLAGPGNARGRELLLNVLERVQGERIPSDYQGGFGDEWRYHGPRAVAFLSRAMAQK